MEKKTTFTLKKDNVSSFSSFVITGRQMAYMFGKKKTMQLLCHEAEALLEKYDNSDVTMPLTSSGHERLTTCLNMIYELYLWIENRKYETDKIWTLDEGRKLIDICKGYTK